MTALAVKRPPARSLRFLVGALGLGGMFAVLALFGVGSYAVRAVLQRVEHDNDGRRSRQIVLLLERQFKTTRQLVEEYAFWNATWNFVDHPSGSAATRFAHENFTD